MKKYWIAVPLVAALLMAGLRPEEHMDQNHGYTHAR